MEEKWICKNILQILSIFEGAMNKNSLGKDFGRHDYFNASLSQNNDTECDPEIHPTEPGSQKLFCY